MQHTKVRPACKVPDYRIRLDRVPVPRRLHVGNGIDTWLFEREPPHRRGS